MNKMRPIHPGEVLREEFLIPHSLSANALAQALRVPAPRINDIVRERRGVSPDTALRLARFFGTTPQFWLNLQASHDLKIAKPGPSRRLAAWPGSDRRAQPDHAVSATRTRTSTPTLSAACCAESLTSRSSASRTSVCLGPRMPRSSNGPRTRTRADHARRRHHDKVSARRFSPRVAADAQAEAYALRTDERRHHHRKGFSLVSR